jgi:hypothetical protein
VSNLVLVFCLVSNREHCIEHRPYEPMPAMHCMVMAELAAAKFVAIHRGWRLAHWRCRPHRRPDPQGVASAPMLY